jgi:hypothetical protein
LFGAKSDSVAATCTDKKRTANVVAALNHVDFLAIFAGSTTEERRLAAGRKLFGTKCNSFAAMHADNKRTANVVAALNQVDFLAIFPGSTTEERRLAAGRKLFGTKCDSFAATCTDKKRTANVVAALNHVDFLAIFPGSATEERRLAAGSELFDTTIGGWVCAFERGDKRAAMVANLALGRKCSGLQHEVVRGVLSKNHKLCRAMSIRRPSSSSISCDSSDPTATATSA